MNITVWSYVDQLAISVITDDRTLDDPHEATDAIIEAFSEIREAWWTGRCMQFLAVATHGLGNHLLALLLIGCSDTILESNGARRNPRARCP